MAYTELSRSALVHTEAAVNSQWGMASTQSESKTAEQEYEMARELPAIGSRNWGVPLNAAITEVFAAEDATAIARAQAQAAAAAAEAVPATSDAVIAQVLGDPGTDTYAALNATILAPLRVSVFSREEVNTVSMTAIITAWLDAEVLIRWHGWRALRLRRQSERHREALSKAMHRAQHHLASR
jgi:hypothetical protein